MSYDYQTERPLIFTEEGMAIFMKIRDNVHKLLAQSGAVRMQEAVSVGSGDSWLKLACVDHLVERKELREVTPPGTTAGQHRVFVN